MGGRAQFVILRPFRYFGDADLGGCIVFYVLLGVLMIWPGVLDFFCEGVSGGAPPYSPPFVTNLLLQGYSWFVCSLFFLGVLYLAGGISE